MANVEEIYRLLPSVVKFSDKNGYWLGSVIGPHHIVTCAHCLVTDDGQLCAMDSVKLQIFGEDRPREGDAICRPVPHYAFQQTKDGRRHGFRNDIAIVPLRDPVPSEIEVLGILSPNDEKQLDRNTMATLFHYAGGSQLVQSEVNFARIYTVEGTDFYHDRVLAVSAKTEDGDSGGPLLVKMNDSSPRWYQIGVHSQSAEHEGAILGLASNTRLCHRDMYAWIEETIRRLSQQTTEQYPPDA